MQHRLNRYSTIAGGRDTAQGGFMLIEALIAMLLFSLAVLGLVGLQASLTRATSDAKYRADAAYLAQDLIGQLWADSGHLSSYGQANCAGYAPCRRWSEKVAATLPAGGLSNLKICTGTESSADCQDALGGAAGRVLIKIHWTTAGESTHYYSTSSSINP